MSNRYNLSPTDKLNYVQKGKIKGRGKKFLKQLLISLFILGVLVLIMLPYARNIKKKKDLENEIAKIQEDIYKYEKSNEELREFLSYLESDQAVEERARINLGLQKEGEQVIVIKRKISEDGQEDEESLGFLQKETSNFKKWLNYFFH